MDANSGAQSLAADLTRAALEPDAVSAADESAKRQEAWFVAFSGGADSLALLLLVWAHWPQQRARLHALHFNHRLRGQESEADEAFCASLCQSLSIPLFVAAWSDRPANPSEDDARRARHAFFNRASAQTASAMLFTGHHLDDVVETMFMRLGRGATAAGLSGPRAVRPWGRRGTIARLLLNHTKAEIVEALRRAKLDWREDASNAASRYLRNRVRHDVVPAWVKALGDAARGGAALTRRWLQEDDEALEWWLDQAGFPPTADELNLKPLVGKPRALWRRALRRWLPGAILSRQAFEALLAVCERGAGRLSVGDGFAEVKGDRLWFERADPSRAAWAAATLLPGAVSVLPCGAEVSAVAVAVDRTLLHRLASGAVDSTTEAFAAVGPEGLHVRPWASGDRYRPLGAPGSAKLQDLFTNRKVPQADRMRIPVFCSADGHIVWVPGCPPADHCKLTQHSVTAVQLTYRAGTSTVRKQS